MCSSDLCVCVCVCVARTRGALSGLETRMPGIREIRPAIAGRTAISNPKKGHAQSGTGTSRRQPLLTTLHHTSLATDHGAGDPPPSIAAIAEATAQSLRRGPAPLQGPRTGAAGPAAPLRVPPPAPAIRRLLPRLTGGAESAATD